jgi:hypothetical protein
MVIGWQYDWISLTSLNRFSITILITRPAAAVPAAQALFDFHRDSAEFSNSAQTSSGSEATRLGGAATMGNAQEQALAALAKRRTSEYYEKNPVKTAEAEFFVIL